MRKTRIKTMQVKETPAWSLTGWDWIKSAIVTSIAGGLSVLYTGLVEGTVDWRTVGIAAATTGVGYILKNLPTTSVKEA